MIGAQMSVWALVWSLGWAVASPTLEITGCGSATLDVPVVLGATLEPQAEAPAGPFRFHWVDDRHPTRWPDVVSPTAGVSRTFTWPAAEYSTGDLGLNVSVYRTLTGQSRRAWARARCQMKLRADLAGRLLVNGSAVAPGDVYMSSDHMERMHVELSDPEHYFDANRTMTYWFVNATHYGSTRGRSEFPYRFPPGRTQVEAIFLAVHPEHAGEPGNRTLDVDGLAPDELRRQLKAAASPGLKFGQVRTTFLTLREMTAFNVTGETWFRHGELLNLKIFCDGTGPWDYCWTIRHSGYNVTGNETCRAPQTMPEHCQFPALWYFRQSGTYDMLFIASNHVSRIVQVVHIHVYDVHKQMPLSLVVVPLCSLLAASAACVAGIFAFITLRRNLSVEIADFDFGHSALAEELEFKTFWERLKDSVVQAFSHPNDVSSFISSASSRSVGGGSVGIHYGSMT